MRHQRIALALCLSLLSAAPLAAEGSWTPIGPEGGAAAALAFAPSRPATVYAGLDQRGVYRSTDRGQTWTLAGLRGLHFYDLAVDPASPSAVYAATATGLRKSTDGGSSWRRLDVPELRLPVLLVAVHPRNPSILFASDGETLVRSSDRGLTWRGRTGWPQRVQALSFAPSRPDTLYAGAADGVWQSTDAGRTWRRTRGPLNGVTALAVDSRSSRILHAGLDSGEILKSSDGGATWRTGLPGNNVLSVMAIVVDPADPALVYAAVGGELFRSRNGGRAWERRGVGLRGSLRTALEAPPYGLLAGTSAGVFISTDRALSFQPRHRGIQALPILDLAIDSQNPPRLYVSTPVSLFKTRNRGAFWLPLTNVPNYLHDTFHRLRIDPLDPETVYTSVTEGVARSVDGGETWTDVRGLFCLAPSALYLDPQAPSTLFLYGRLLTPFCGTDVCQLYRSVDAGSTWDCVPSSLFLVGVDPLTSAVYAKDNDRLWSSTDGGATWTVLSENLRKPYLFLTFSPLVPEGVWLPAHGEVGRSSDGGRTWQFSSNGLPPVPIVALVADPVEAGTLYAGTRKDGVFKSTDAGLFWSPVGTWPAGVLLQGGLVVDPADPSILYAGTNVGGVLSLNQDE